MCDKNHAHSMSRRGFAAMAAGAVGLALLPLRARASGAIEAMGVTCIDYRVVDEAVKFFAKLGLTNEYDTLSLAGASLAAVSPKFPTANAAFWDQLAISKSLHHIKRVVFVDHRDCGAYKVAFGDKFVGHPPEAEAAQHKGVMKEVKAELAKRHPDLGAEFYLLALDGTAVKIEV